MWLLTTKDDVGLLLEGVSLQLTGWCAKPHSFFKNCDTNYCGLLSADYGTTKTFTLA